MLQPGGQAGQKDSELPTIQEVAEWLRKVESEEEVEILHFSESFAMQEIPYRK
jgi:hypothetical protein